MGGGQREVMEGQMPPSSYVPGRNDDMPANNKLLVVASFAYLKLLERTTSRAIKVTRSISLITNSHTITFENSSNNSVTDNLESFIQRNELT